MRASLGEQSNTPDPGHSRAARPFLLWCVWSRRKGGQGASSGQQRGGAGTWGTSCHLPELPNLCLRLLDFAGLWGHKGVQPVPGTRWGFLLLELSPLSKCPDLAI